MVVSPSVGKYDPAIHHSGRATTSAGLSDPLGWAAPRDHMATPPLTPPSRLRLLGSHDAAGNTRVKHEPLLGSLLHLQPAAVAFDDAADVRQTQARGPP